MFAVPKERNVRGGATGFQVYMENDYCLFESRRESAAASGYVIVLRGLSLRSIMRASRGRFRASGSADNTTSL
jgi:hypothetical protein